MLFWDGKIIQVHNHLEDINMMLNRLIHFFPTQRSGVASNFFTIYREMKTLSTIFKITDTILSDRWYLTASGEWTSVVGNQYGGSACFIWKESRIFFAAGRVDEHASLLFPKANLKKLQTPRISERYFMATSPTSRTTESHFFPYISPTCMLWSLTESFVLMYYQIDLYWTWMTFER